MRYTEWLAEKYRSREKCRVIGTLNCMPVHMNSYCMKCYEREAKEGRCANVIIQTRIQAQAGTA